MHKGSMIGLVVVVSVLAGSMAWGAAEGKKVPAAAPVVKAAAADEMVVCPVLKEKIKKSAAYDSVVYKGTTYYFCCAGCKPEFVKHPEKYVPKVTKAAPVK